MSKQISSLSVGLFGDVSGFAKAFGKDAVGSVGSFVGSIAKMGSVLGVADLVAGGLSKIGEAIAGGFGVREQFEAIDANAKLSDRLGITTESLAGLQHAASLAGVSNEELTGGFEKMFKTLGEAVGGSKEAAATLSALGLSAATLQNEAPDQAFKEIAGSIANISNPAQRAAAAMDVFGKSGQSLLPLLTQGANGIEAAQQEAQRLGLTFSRLDAAKVEAANDAVTRLKGAFTGIARTVAIALAPFVEGGANKLTGWIVAALPTVEAGLAKVGQLFSNVYDVVAPVMSNIWGTITSVWTNVYGYLAGIGASIYEAIATRWEATVESVTGYVMAIWDVLTAVWGVISDLAAQAWEGVTMIWQWGTDLITGQTDAAGASTKSTFADILDNMNAFRDYMTDVFLAVEYSIQHWQDYFEMAGTDVALVVVRTGNQIAYVFQEVIPTYVGYGIAVVIAKLQDFYNFTHNIFANLGGNIAVLFTNLPGLIKGTTKWSDIWKPLTQGFEETVIQWPGIADREKSEMEKQLEDEADWVENNFAGGLADHIAKRTSEAHEAAGGIIKGLKDLFNFKGQKVEAPKISPLHPTIKPDDLSLSITPEIKQAKAVAVGSAEAQILRYGGPQLAAIASGKTVSAAAAAAPVPVSAGAVPTQSAAPGSEGWFRDKFNQAYVLWQRTELNTRTPQIAPSTV